MNAQKTRLFHALTLRVAVVFGILGTGGPRLAWAERAASEGDPLPTLAKTGVLVPWEDFRKLLEEIRQAHPPVPLPPPPVDFALAPCAATAVVDGAGRQVRVRLSFELRVLDEEKWVEVPAIAEGVALTDFRIDDRPAEVYRKNGYHNVALRGAGRHRVDLEYIAPVSESRGTKSAYLRFPQAPVVTLDLAVPTPGLDFELGDAVLRSIDRSARGSRVQAAFQQAREASISWFKQVELEEKETKLFGELHSLFAVGEGLLRGTAYAAFSIHGKGTDTLRLALPTEVSVLDVVAQGLRDWAVAPAVDGAGGNVLTVRLSYPAQGAYSFQLSFELPLAATGETRLPDLALLDVLREKGFIAVVAATNVEINPRGAIENASPVDPSELPADLAAMAGPSILYAFKYLKHPVDVALAIVKHDDLDVKRTIVESAHLFTYLSPEGKQITSARYCIKNNRKQFLEVTLPPGGEGWGAYVEGQPVKAGRDAKGKILVPLKKTALDAAGDLDAFEVELVYFERVPLQLWGRQRLRGPQLDVDVMEVQWNVFLPRDRRYHGFGGNLHPDEELNHILYLGRTAYNLEAEGDLGLLRTEEVQGETVITDGKNKLALDDARLTVGREQTKIDAQDLERVGRPPASAAEEGAAADRDVAANERKKQVSLEREIDELRQRRNDGPAVARLPAAPQVSNVGQAQAFYGGGGRARGVLPVRFVIPVDGLRLSFTGRLLTAAEEPLVSIGYRPSSWVLSRSAVLLLSFLCGALLPSLAWRRGLALRLALVVPAAAALVAIFVFLPWSRAAWAAGLVLGLAASLVGRRVVARSAAVATALCVLALAPGQAQAAPELPDLHETEITLSWQDFKDLVARIHVPPPVEPTPPAEAFLRSAEYRGRLERGILTLEGELVLDVLKSGWAALPIATGASVIAWDGAGALLNRDGGQLRILAQGPQSYRIKTTLAFPATDHPGENRLVLTLPDCPRNLVDLGVDPAFRDVAVETGLAYSTRGSHLFVSLPQGALALKYTLPFRRAEEQAGEEVAQEPRVQSIGYQMLNVGDGVLSGVLVQDYDVRVAPVDHFDLDLPPDVEVFDCAAPGLESWRLLKREGQRYLRVKLLAPASGAVRVLVYFEGAYDAKTAKVGVPRFAPLEVERESGFVAVAADGAEVELALSGNLLPADVTEIPADVRGYGGSLVSACKYSGAPDAASISVIEHEDAPVLTAIIESLNATAALLENGTEATWIDLVVKNNRKQFLEFRVPGEGVEVWSLLLDGEPAKPKRDDDAFLVPLPSGSGEVASRISLVLLRKGAPVRSFGRLRPWLPSFDVPVSEALWTIYLPTGRRYVAQGDEFRAVVATAPLVAHGGALLRSAVGEVAAPAKELSEAYADAVSDKTAEAQVRQEAAVRQQMLQKGSARRGSLPVRIAIPGGIERLPRVTVSRMLIVGDEPNTFPIRVYPGWLGVALRWLQPLALLGASLLLGLALAGLVGRSGLMAGMLVAALGLVPVGGMSPVGALVALGLGVALTRLAVALYRRWVVPAVSLS